MSGAPLEPIPERLAAHFWTFRTALRQRRDYGYTPEEQGLRWFDYTRFHPDRFQTPFSIAFPFVATHNHFVLDRRGKVFNRTAPVIKLPAEATEDDHLGLVGLLNSSTACFWLQQVCHNKGGPGGASSKDEKWHDFYEHDGTKLLQFPVPAERPLALARALDDLARERADFLPAALAARGAPTADTLRDARARAGAIRERMIALQEELDWRCHRLYGVTGDDLCLPAGDRAVSDPADSALSPSAVARSHIQSSDAVAAPTDGALSPVGPPAGHATGPSGGGGDPCPPAGAGREVPDVPDVPAVRLGERAFEIVLARGCAAGKVETKWFERHGAAPVTAVPDRWPAAYRALVERRIAAIEAQPALALIEQPAHKRAGATSRGRRSRSGRCAAGCSTGWRRPRTGPNHA